MVNISMNQRSFVRKSQAHVLLKPSIFHIALYDPLLVTNDLVSNLDVTKVDNGNQYPRHSRFTRRQSIVSLPTKTFIHQIETGEIGPPLMTIESSSYPCG